MKKVQKDHKSHKMRGLFAVLTILILGIFGALLYLDAPQKNTSQNITTATPEPSIQSASSQILMSGTIFWGRYFQDWSKNQTDTDFSYPFAKLGSFQPDQYKHWIADLECPVTTKDIPAAEQESTLSFNCLPVYLPEAAKYFDIMNLANNHSDNAGREGYDQTVSLLKNAGVTSFGDYATENKDNICKIIFLDFDIKSDQNTEPGKLPIAFCAYHYFYRMPQDGEIAQIEEYAKYMPVIATLHMGVEYKAQSDPLQQSVAHSMIDAGAEFVVANNPHWVQQSESYKGKLILYSTGNFIFDQQGAAEVTQSASLDAKLEVKTAQNDLKAWLGVQKSCRDYTNAQCLSIIRARNLNRITLQKSFDIVVGMNKKRQTELADDITTQAVLKRLGWAEVKPKLQQ